jgi:hypothetical protein
LGDGLGYATGDALSMDMRYFKQMLSN